MKTSRGSTLLSLGSAAAGAAIGGVLVALPFVTQAYAHSGERLLFFAKWLIPFVIGFAALYGLADWLVRRKYLALRRLGRALRQSLW